MERGRISAILVGAQTPTLFAHLNSSFRSGKVTVFKAHLLKRGPHKDIEVCKIC